MKFNKKIKKLENMTDEIEEQISNFLMKVSESKLSSESSREIQGLVSIITDLERIADIFLRMSNDLVRKHHSDINFNKEQNDSLNHLAELVNKAISVMLKNLKEDHTDLNEANEVESKINSTVKKLRKKQFAGIDDSNYDIKAGIVYRDLYNAYEKIGDHIVNVSEALEVDWNEE